jgi:hypothetical protein
MAALRLLAATLVVSAAAVRARAQSYNVDIGVSAVYPTPSSIYGAAPAQTGAWNSVPCSIGTPTTIFDLAGNSGVVTIRLSGGAQMQSNMNLGGASAEALALFGDAHDPGSVPQRWTIAGLASGDYVVYSYALSPVSAQYRTSISVASSPDPAQIVGGAWTGTLALGTTHARHAVTVSAGTDIVVTVERTASPPVNFAALGGLQIVQLSTSGSAFCSGDGVDAAVTTDCPCHNFGLALHGCANSANPVGASLWGSGATAADDVVLRAAGMPATVLSLCFQGDGLQDQPYGDGILCVGGNLVRLRQHVSSGGASMFPDANDPWSLSLRGGVTPGSGALRFYQAYYRNASTLFCPPATFNATNAWQITW